MTDTGRLNLDWCDTLLAALTAAGVDTVFMAPGSRSTPLVLAAVRRPELRLIDHFDERGLAFLALGYGRASGKPAAVITTSGTAVANLLPAVVEAWQDHVPLLLLTADRPPELRNTGSNQTIDQVNIFGSFTRKFHDLPCPGDGLTPAELSTLASAAFTATRHGPVHLNVMLREPLQPGGALPPPPPLPAPASIPALAAPADADALALLRDAMLFARTGWILAGPGLHPLEQMFARQLARQLGWVVVPDVLSPLRFVAAPEIAAHADLLLLEEPAAADSPRAVLHLGDRMVSKRLGQYLAAHPDIPIWRVSDKPNPIEIVPGRVTTIRRAPLDALELPRDAASASASLAESSARVETCLSALLDAADAPLTEPVIARALTGALPAGHTLFLGSSMPVRDVLMFGATRATPVTPVANRGASGIDGTIASAAGFASASGQPVTLLLGDLSTLHDLNSFALLRARNLPVIVVVVNNHGGGIFKFLPPAKLEANVGSWWTTPHRWGFASAAQMFDLPYARADGSAAELVRLHAEAVARGGPALIEVVTDGTDNVAEHQRLQEAVRAALRSGP